MSIESKIFKKTKFNKEKLIAYGFEKVDNYYKYSKEMSNGFKIDLFIDSFEQVTGKIIDLSLDEEYTNYRVENLKGEFVNSIREEYKSILLDVADKCCENLFFITPQANRIGKKIIELYDNQPEFLWKSSPDFAIFRHSTNQKWYALIGYIDRKKLDKNEKGMVEVMNLKINETELDTLLKQKGFYLAYHMNKKNWISITLDESLSDEEVMEYVKKSYFYTS